MEVLLKQRILLLDGAMGTMLQANGLKPGECPEWFGVNNPEVLGEIHYRYIEAGADIIQTNTFGANRFKLMEYGLEDKVYEINSEAVRIAKEKAQGKALVAASIGPTGKLLKPIGDVSFDDLYAAFKEQIVACARAGADLISIETMTDIGEMRAALIAAKYNTDIPVIAHMTFEKDGRTMMGTDPVTALIILEALQPLAIGANCSGGALQLLPVIEEMNRYSSVFLSVEPNAGLPALVDGKTVFPDTPEEMAEYALLLRDAGANIIGGCCGTTPEHIKAIAEVLKGLSPLPREKKRIFAFASRSRHVIIGPPYPLAFIGERINPTARKKLAQDIKEGHMAMVVEEAKKQVESGAPMLDVNMGVPGIDEKEAMKKAVIAIQAVVDVPLSLDSTHPEAIEEGLKNFVGRALINSTTGEEKNLAKILPLAKKYGAAVLGLCLDENGIPPTAEERVKIGHKIYNEARKYGLRDEDIYLDSLVKTASAEQREVMETIKGLTLIKEELGVGTVLGVSNVSHGLPSREVLNSTFLAMALAAGLDLPIMNPFDSRMMDVVRAAAVLLNRDADCKEFISFYKGSRAEASREVAAIRHPLCRECNIPDLVARMAKGEAEKGAKEGKTSLPAEEKEGSLIKIRNAVLEGNVEGIIPLLEEALEKEKVEPLTIINNALIPGIEKAGELYDRKEYFLPQLMRAADAMKTAFSYLKPMLAEESDAQRGVVVLATVEGDIHDIGKNIVGVMLENYGFKVIDLGKDVKAKDIVDAAQREKADIVGLSALMTTTMPRMKEVIEEVKKRGLSCRVMVGGAVLTQEYADSIGADGYSEDARSAVLLAQQLMQRAGFSTVN
ncbi:methionine synthase (B12-dependent) [Thermosyntropha lipolytica DSM 11003]|uniref:Methionine synthase n=1 Tax=Thermosyntropha lipolytica DSM 11003 TaxID=1123382 RepID=A0A1M5PAC8_9FIRM|nr:methionine synthase (B12-dependent) [Thermosyntropha lipolytica DSM 11003]